MVLSYIIKFKALFLLFFYVGNLFSQTFTNNIPQAISESIQYHTPTVIPILVNGLPNSIGANFGVTSVCLNIQHPQLNNLTLKLVSPDGTKVTLMHQIGNTDDNLSATCFDDNSSPIYYGNAPYTGSFRSTLPLGQVNNGQNPNGTWNIWIYDDIPEAGSEGTFLNASLSFGNQPALPFYFSNSTLPIIELETQDKAINNYSKEKVGFKSYDSPFGLNDWQNDSPSYSGSAYIEWQGWSAPGFPKKNFDFDIADTQGNKIDVPLLGLPTENDWVLKAEYLDRTLMKNHLVFELFQKMGRYAPRTRFCEVVLDGEYLGVYTLQEKIKRDKNRVKIDKLLTNDVSLPNISGGYIYEINNTGSAFDWTSNYSPINEATTDYNVEFRVVYPDRDFIPIEQLNYIKEFTDSFENALSSPQFQDSNLGYRAYIDVYSFIDFMLISEFAANYDTYGRSFFLVKENQNDGGKLKAGPPWDFDQGFGYYWPSTQGWVWEITNYYWPFPFWWTKFWSDEQYRRETECRWKSYRQGALSNSVIQQTIDSLQLRLASAVGRNEIVWPNQNGTSYQENVNNLQIWITQRLAWIDDSLDLYNTVFPELSNLSDTSICAGVTLNYGLSNAYSYDWDPGSNSQIMTPTETGFYTLTATDTSGCFSRQTVHIEARKPNVNFNVQLVEGNHEIICLAQDTMLIDYVWSVGNDTILSDWTLPYTFNQNGYYTVSLSSIDSSGCEWSESIVHWVNSSNVPANGFLLFPNPCEANFWIVISEELVGKPYTITDGFGNLLTQGIISGIQQKIESSWASGIYLVRINDMVKRLVVE